MGLFHQGKPLPKSEQKFENFVKSSFKITDKKVSHSLRRDWVQLGLLRSSFSALKDRVPFAVVLGRRRWFPTLQFVTVWGWKVAKTVPCYSS